MASKTCAGSRTSSSLTACYPQFDVERRAEHRAAVPEGGVSAGAGGAGVVVGGDGGGQAGAGVAEGGAGTPGSADCQRGQALLSGYVQNVRDLGGIPVAGGAVACGAIYRGGPLKNLLAPGCEQLATLGVKTVLDLRMPSEQSSNPTSACSAQRVSAPLPIPYGLGPAEYLADFDEVASIAKAFHTFGDPAAYPIYFHTFGRDRTGVLGALLLSALGASREDIVSDYMLSKATVGRLSRQLGCRARRDRRTRRRRGGADRPGLYARRAGRAAFARLAHPLGLTQRSI